jgi:membrane protein implicated in regulation of membrane protease activity
MPQLILLAIFAGCGWWLYYKFINDAKKLSRRSERRRKEQMTGANGTLVQDPKTGEYRVKREDE